MTGREKCEFLKKIRKAIAEANGIEYLSAECDYDGKDCLGHCPKCDAESRYLDMELKRLIDSGKDISIVQVALDAAYRNVSVEEQPEDPCDEEVPLIGVLLPEDDADDESDDDESWL